MYGIEAVCFLEEVGRRLRRAADPAHLADLVRRDAQFPERAHDRRRDRVVAAAGAQRRHRALVVAAGQTDRVLLERGVMNLRLGNGRRHTVTSITAACRPIALRTPPTTVSALSGTPPKSRIDCKLLFSTFVSSKSRLRSWPSRFCSITKIVSCSARNDSTSALKGNPRTRM